MKTFLPQFGEVCTENETNGKDLYPRFKSTVLLHACSTSQTLALNTSHTFSVFDQGASDDSELAIN